MAGPTLIGRDQKIQRKAGTTQTWWGRGVKSMKKMAVFVKKH